MELSRDIEHYLAVLSKLYKHSGETEKLSVIVNSQTRVIEGYTYDNWNGGIHGHALYFSVSEEVYVRSFDKKEKLQSEIRSDLNKTHNFQDEHIAEVFIEPEKNEDRDWRQESGALENPVRTVAPAASVRIWGEWGYKVFLSHKSAVKRETSQLRDKLDLFGISAFVAHEDIRPTKAWQEEIENALTSMDAFVALLTKDFHESEWTDQEVGFALGRQVPLICVKLGRVPYGFIGKFQALPCTWEDAPLEIAKLLIKDRRMVDAYTTALPLCKNFADGITLSEVLPHIDKLTIDQAERMISAFNTNYELRNCWGFNGAKPRSYGDGLMKHLSRITGLKFRTTSAGVIERE